VASYFAASFFQMEIVRPHPPRAPRAQLAILMTALIVLVVGYGASRTTAFQWLLLNASLRMQFPQVRWITTRELASWLHDRDRQPPVLLDVRTASEWNVSHLPGARRVDPGVSAEVALPNAANDIEVVAYDAVGYRSAGLAMRLRAAGFTHVQTLDGSIFQWANEHRPLVHNSVPATRVHPYTQFWGRLLADEVRASL
jgi:rhodanese-related sulfurtransferase